MKDILDFEVNVGDYILAKNRFSTTLSIYKVLDTKPIPPNSKKCFFPVVWKSIEKNNYSNFPHFNTMTLKIFIKASEEQINAAKIKGTIIE